MISELKSAGDKITVTLILFEEPGTQITITFKVFAELKSAGDNMTATFIVFAEPGTQ